MRCFSLDQIKWKNVLLVPLLCSFMKVVCENPQNDVLLCVFCGLVCHNRHDDNTYNWRDYQIKIKTVRKIQINYIIVVS